jgi:uncharacterized protein (TIGR03435 family)
MLGTAEKPSRYKTTMEGYMGFKSISLAIVLSASPLAAQNPARPAFEVVSIRPSQPGPPPGGVGGLRLDGAQVRTAYLTLKDYIGMAYRVKPYQISGPDWVGSDRFDVAATLPDNVPTTQIPEMIQSLLADRFQLSFHREQKDFPAYVLEVAKTGLKISESGPDPELENADAKAPQAFTGGGSNQGISFNLGRGTSVSFSNGKFEAKRLNMASLAATLERFLDRPVVDMTDLKKNYDFSFDVTPDDYRAMLLRSAVVAGVTLPPDVLRLFDPTVSPASLFDALDKLGLKLSSRKASMDLLVVDKILKTPTEN